MIAHYFKTLKDSELKVLDAPRTGVWTHVVDPNEAELEMIIEEYGLDRLIIEDALDFFEVPRMEKSGSATYFFTRYPFDDKKEDIDTAPLLIVVGESFVLTLAQKEVPQFNFFINGKIEIQTTQKARFFIQIMDILTKSFEHELTILRKAVHRNRIQIRKIGNREIERLVNYEHTLNDIVASLVPTNLWLQQLTKGNYMQLYQEDMELMEDLMIDNNQLVDSARSVLKTIQNVRNATESILANRLNATMKRLTTFTIILTIPTIIASLYGMNVAVPLGNNPLAFWIILIFIIIVVVLTVVTFKKTDLL